MPTRRQLLLAAPALAATAFADPPTPSPAEPFGYCFNTSTIREQRVSLPDTVKLVAAAGYHGIEPWVREIDAYVKAGGSLADLRKQIADAGLQLPDAIGFPEWIVDDPAKRQKGMDEAKRAMDLVRQLGGERVAAPPVGATGGASVDLLQAADRYHALCELGEQMGVTPMVELWGHSRNLSRLGETVLVALEGNHPRACVLPDVYHLHKGGSDFAALRHLRPSAIGIFHVNDYPATPDRAKITDAHRVFPGDGVAPLAPLFRTLRDAGYRGMLSLELFNPTYWKRDAGEVVREGLAKTRAAVRAALG